MKSKLTVLFSLLSSLTAVVFLSTFFSVNEFTAPLTASAGSSDQLTYLPIMFKAPDLYMTGFEANQAIQDANNNVPLVANRDTVLRVFTTSIDGQGKPNKTISLSATRGGTPLGSLSIGPKTASGSSTRANLNSTFNFTLPAGWLSGTIVVTATDLETGESGSTTLTFNTVPTLDVVLVPIDYTHTPSGGFFSGPTTDHISDWMMRSYPLSDMNVTVRPSYWFTGNLGTGAAWSQLLDEVTTLKFIDGAPSSTVYYAYIDFDCGWFDCSSGGIAGIGWISFRAAVGLDFGATDSTGELAGHEIGHNLGRSHAPCGGPAGVDPDYPYAGADIGQYGLDNIGASLTLLAPTAYKDVMSYCGPEWVSDYTYEALYDDQVVNGAFVMPPAAEEVLLIRGLIDGESMSLKPAYTLPAAASAPAHGSAYAVELLAADGQVVASYPVALRVAEEPGVVLRAIHTAVPLPETPVASFRIVEATASERERTILAERTLTQVGANVVQTLDATLAQSLTVVKGTNTAVLRWGLPDTPAVVRYTPDDGDTWTTVGLDVLGGELAVDLTALPEGENGRFEILLADTTLRLTAELHVP